VAKILVTNDDGIDAPGLALLAELAADFGEAMVAAPAEQHSQQGHRLTTNAPIAVEQVRRGWFRVQGTPADCVRLGLWELCPDADWVFAGVNDGGNLGADIYCSGTVAAAREAALLGRSGLAISQYVVRSRPLDWEGSRRRARAALRFVLEQPQDGRGYWNINLPHPENGADGFAPALCPVDPSPFDVRFERREGGYFYCGNYHRRPRVPDSDVDWCFRGGIAVSRLRL
jgi:5'-nucleotidase